MRWTDNDELAKRMIQEGHHWEHVVAGLLAAEGLHVEVQEQTVREDVSEALDGKHLGSVDMFVEGLRTQVKSRNLTKFRDPVFLCSERSWKGVGDTTDLWICILRGTKEIRCVSGEKARKHSVCETTRDRVRNIHRYKVRCLSLEHWSSLNALVKWISKKKN